MTPDQKKRLLKLLNMTKSTNDGEALNALRAITAYLATLNTTWEALLDGAAAVEVEQDEEAVEAREFLQEVQSLQLKDGDRRFAESLQEGFDKYGSLTDRQMAALQKLRSRY